MKELGVWGGNPSVTWNDYLQRWLMVWHGWDPPNILLSHSQDLLHWAPAVRIVVVRLSCLPPVMCPAHRVPMLMLRLSALPLTGPAALGACCARCRGESPVSFLPRGTLLRPCA